YGDRETPGPVARAPRHSGRRSRGRKMETMLMDFRSWLPGDKQLPRHEHNLKANGRLVGGLIARGKAATVVCCSPGNRWTTGADCRASWPGGENRVKPHRYFPAGDVYWNTPC